MRNPQLTDDERQANRDKAFAQIEHDLTNWDGKSGRWYWLSYVDPGKPEGQRFLGVCILFAPSLLAAPACAQLLNISPGGEVGIQELPEDAAAFFHPRWSLRLLSRAECEQQEKEAAAWRQAKERTLQ